MALPSRPSSNKIQPEAVAVRRCGVTANASVGILSPKRNQQDQKNSAWAIASSDFLVSAVSELLMDFGLRNSITFPAISRSRIGLTFLTSFRALNSITFPMA
jgi:hypothetical protein